MTDLNTTYLGLPIDSPIIPSASPLSEQIGAIRKMEDAGAGAVVLYSLFEEQISLESLEIEHHLSYGTESFAEALTYFPEPDDFIDLGPDGYLEHIRKAKDAVDIPVIASLNGTSLDGWTNFAHQIEQAGADALELNLYNIPNNLDTPGAIIEEQHAEVIRQVKAAIKIPVAVKLSPFYSNMAHTAKHFAEAGADGLVMFNRFYQPDINLETLEVYPNIQLSTAQDLRLPMRWIAMLYDRVSVDFAATSGVHTADDAVKVLMTGAQVAMMASALFKSGIDYIRVVRSGLRRWLEEHEYDSVDQLRGSMSQRNSQNPGAFERAQYVKAVSSLPDEYREAYLAWLPDNSS